DALDDGHETVKIGIFSTFFRPLFQKNGGDFLFGDKLGGLKTNPPRRGLGRGARKAFMFRLTATTPLRPSTPASFAGRGAVRLALATSGLVALLAAALPAQTIPNNVTFRNYFG